MPDANLVNQEDVLWTGSVSNWHYKGRWFLALLLFALLAGSFYFELTDIADVIWPVRAGLCGVILFLSFWIKLDQSRRKYTVTQKRVIVEFGIVARSSNEIRVQDIRSINLTKAGLSGLLGIGRIEFSSAATDDADVIFWSCPESEKVRDLVRSLQA